MTWTSEKKLNKFRTVSYVVGGVHTKWGGGDMYNRRGGGCNESTDVGGGKAHYHGGGGINDHYEDEVECPQGMVE